VITVVRGKLRGGDLVHLRLGDKRRGGRGTRVQTFAEEEFHWRAFVCPDGTSACFEVDLVDHIVIQPGPMSALRIIAPPAMTTGASLPVMVRAEMRGETSVWASMRVRRWRYSIQIGRRSCPIFGGTVSRGPSIAPPSILRSPASTTSGRAQAPAGRSSSS
jgi:hypothetical protein